MKDRRRSNGWEAGGRGVVGVCAEKMEVSQNKEDTGEWSWREETMGAGTKLSQWEVIVTVERARRN